MEAKIKYCFTNQIWQHQGKGGWVFVSLPKPITIEIRSISLPHEEGWGRLSVTAIIDELTWKTAIWFDTKRSTYLLPLKAEIRKKKKLEVKDVVTIHLVL